MNRQEIAHQTKVRLHRFLSGDPLERDSPSFSLGGEGYAIHVRLLQVLLDRESVSWRKGVAEGISVAAFSKCLKQALSPPPLLGEMTVEGIRRILDILRDFDLGDPATAILPSAWRHISVIPPPRGPRDRSGEFWTYVPKEDRCFLTRIIGPPKKPRDGGLAYVMTEIRDPVTGITHQSRIDDEDVDMYISNGFSRESARSSTSCLLCEVCLVVCGYPVEPSDVGQTPTDYKTATAEELDKWNYERPALMCSGCSMVIHADCVGASAFVDKAILHHLARTGRDWFCGGCVESTALSSKHALSYGYHFTEPMTRREFEKRGKARGQVLGVKPGMRTEDTERLFWDLVDDDHRGEIPVLYASDLDSLSVAEGPFPVDFSASSCSWDLRSLSLSSESVLKHLPGASMITGVSRPWMYLGSPLSAFCWHAEDHFLCSISYLHSGSAKVWYTIPGRHRAAVEAAIASLLPDLARANKDLHHHLTTMISPHVLSTFFNIPVGRVVQNPGEFIVTFPQAHHCGFNTGCNLAEAVNVACPDWLPHGLRSISAYAQVQRSSLLCFEKLVHRITLSVVNKTEKRKSVADFCTNALTQFANRLEEAVAEDSSVVVDEDQVLTTCSKCKQFCFFVYFECDGVNRCLSCRGPEEPSRVFLRHSVEELRDLAQLTSEKSKACTDIRRSARRLPSSKRART